MAEIYSTRFAAVTLSSNGGTVIYTAPAASALVLRDMDLFTNSTAGCYSVVELAGQAIWVAGPNTATNQSFEWRGRQVFEEGEEIEVFVNSLSAGAFVWVMCSGYLFT